MRDLSWHSALNEKRYHTAERTLHGFYMGFSPIERVLFWFFAILLTVASVSMLIKVSNAFTVAVPAHGGSLTEGVIGSPRFINPLLATSDADRDLVSLVYAGLLHPNKSGSLEGELADHYTISDDGLTYTVTLKDNIYFHDGVPVTADDVVFTIGLAQNSAIKSPKRANFEGVAVHAADEKTIVFTLPKPYSPFLENLNLGILPKHVWQGVDPDQFAFSRFNIEPIGAGPFRVVKTSYDGAGIPTALTLSSFRRYILGEPFLRTFIIRYYTNEDNLEKALSHGDVESASGLSPKAVLEFSDKKSHVLNEVSLPRVFGVFWNQSHAPVLAHSEVREALALSAPKQAVIDAALDGYGVPMDGPLMTNVHESQKNDVTASTSAAQALLEKNGWKKGDDGIYEKKTKSDTERLAFSLSIPGTPEMQAAAAELESAWRTMGADVSIKAFESGDIAQAVIRPREYDALLFGLVIGREQDLYAFWHSSQRNDPGLNIALYTNITADKLLEEARASTDSDVVTKKNAAFADEVAKDNPAVFLYAPEFLYFTPNNLKGVDLYGIASPSERFSDVYTWYRKEDFVWNIFTQN